MNSSQRRLWLGIVALALAALVWWNVSQGQDNVEEGVKLQMGNEITEPTATFELRFPESVAADREVGQVATPSPLMIRPAIPGEFRWLSTRSGVFTPSAPPTLDTTYLFTLDPRFKNAKLHRSIPTKAFDIIRFSPERFSTNNAPAIPSIRVRFNADVDPEQARSSIEFQGSNGRRVAARIETAKPASSYSDYPDTWARDETWKERFESRQKDRLRSQSRWRQTLADADLKPIPSMLLVTPAEKLAVNQTWKLRVRAGLKSTDGLTLRKDSELEIGRVTPFTVTKCVTHNEMGEGRWITLELSKSLPPEVTSSNLAQWVSVTPSPPELEMDPDGEWITLRGGFNLDTAYTVTAKPGLLAVEDFKLESLATNVVTFAPIPPKLCFPAFSSPQWSGGQRRFDVLALNVPRVRFRARKFDRNTLIHALRGYQRYGAESDRGLDFQLMPGTTVLNKDFDVTAAPDETSRISVSWDDILGKGKPGAVFIVAEQRLSEYDEQPKVGVQSMIQVTDLGLLVKRGSDQTWVHVFSYATGASVAGATVRLMTEDQVLIAESVTDAEGNVALPKAGENRWLMVEKGDDLYAEPVERGNLSTYGFNIPVGWDATETDRHRVMMFTDRDVYRPGERIHLKAFLRDWTGDSLVVPTAQTIQVRLLDPQGNERWKGELASNSSGSLSQSIPVPAGSLGYHRIALAIKGRKSPFEHHVNVQEYEAAPFEIKLEARESYAAGLPVEIPATATYYMGKALSKATLKWSLRAEDRGFAPAGFEDYAFCMANPFAYQLDRGPGSISPNGSGPLSERGTFRIAPDVPLNPKAPQPRECDLIVEVTDVDQKTVSASRHFTRHSSDFYLALRRPIELLREGDSLPVELAAVGVDGKPWNGNVEATVSLTRLEWSNNRVQGSQGTPSYRNTPILTPIKAMKVTASPLKLEGKKWEAATKTQGAFRLDAPGTYLVEARTKDAAGRDVVTEVSVQVYGKEATSWKYENEAHVVLIPNEESYTAGDTATILVKTPIRGTACVTVEREKVLRSFIVKLSGNAPVIQVPIVKGDAPNVFVSVVILRGANDSPRKIRQPDYRYGYCQLNVVNPADRLQVEVKPGADEYRPGRTVKVGGVVRDGLGKASEGAEVTLYAVDEGVLALSGYKTPDAYAWFHAILPLRVGSDLSLPTLLSEDSKEWSFDNKGYTAGDGGPGPGRLRSNFQACAFWHATLRTGADGAFSASFTAPDGLTRYRLIAVASAGGSQFGAGESRFEVNKLLMLEPAMPRFANIGDRLLLRAVLHNQTDVSGEVEVSVKLDPTAAAEGSGAREITRTLNLATRETASVDFPVEFRAAGTAKWIWSARMKHATRTDLVDNVQTTFEVGYPVPLLREVHLGHTRDEKSDLLKDANPQLLEGTGVVKVGLSNTRLSELGEAVRHLLHYPFGCVEQTTSCLMPWIVLKDVREIFPDLGKKDAEFDAAIQLGIARLLAMQTSSGGLSYWPGARDPQLWCSAYGGFGLVLAKKHGHPIPMNSLDGLTSYLSEQLRNTSQMDTEEELSQRCLALYTLALAGKPEPSYHEIIFQKRGKLSNESRALLALAITTSRGDSKMVDELLKPIKSEPSARDFWFGCPQRSLAIRLMAWCAHRPADSNVDILVEELMRLRRNGHWWTTQGDAWAILALSKSEGGVETTRKPVHGTLTRGRERKEFLLDAQTRRSSAAFDLGKSTSRLPLDLVNPKKALIFTNTELAARPAAWNLPRQEHGLMIQRSYQKVEDDGRLTDVAGARVGDRVLVTLEIEAHQEAMYVAVDDPFPSNLEALNPEFKTQQTRAAEQIMDWFSDYHELRTDRALFFRDSLPTGRYTLRYLARVRAAGTATAPSARIEEMYHPDHFGLSGTTMMKTLPLAP